MEFDLATAQEYARSGKVEEWIYTYWRTGYWKDNGAVDYLQSQHVCWWGPAEVALNTLTRCCGPEPEMPWCQDAQVWETAVSEMVESIREVEALPPLFLHYEKAAGTTIVSDGNHRLEALRRRGIGRAWGLFWFYTPKDREDFRLLHTEGSVVTDEPGLSA